MHLFLSIEWILQTYDFYQQGHTLLYQTAATLEYVHKVLPPVKRLLYRL